eukprot:356188-Chlamydomonas_euryale.AAC.8
MSRPKRTIRIRVERASRVLIIAILHVSNDNLMCCVLDACLGRLVRCALQQHRAYLAARVGLNVDLIGALAPGTSRMVGHNSGRVELPKPTALYLSLPTVL